MATKLTVNRRNALKVLAAASGAVLGSVILPKKWSMPIIESGIIPVHAQTSNTLTLSQLVTSQYVFWGHEFSASFHYADSLGEVDDTWTIHAAFTNAGVMPYDGSTLAAIGATAIGDGFSGQITYKYIGNICIQDQPDSTDIANLSISKGPRVSNISTDSVTEIDMGFDSTGKNQTRPSEYS